MESKSGFKECSRCGLRNKPTAKQCDFCGQKFEVVDEWELQVDALDKLNREAKRVEVTEDLSKKIEATILRKEPAEGRREPVVKEVEPAQMPKVEGGSEPKVEHVPEQKEPTTVITFTATEAKAVDVELEGEKAVVEEAPIVEMEEVVLQEQTVPEFDASPQSVESSTSRPKESWKARTKRKAIRRRVRTDGKLFKWKFDVKDRKSVVFMLVLVTGAVIYPTSIALSSSLGTIGAWGLVTLSGLMVVTGISQLAIDWNPAHYHEDNFEHHEIVDICPNCNEHVHKDDERCLACGTEFDPSELL